ncbi:MAG: elongation factor P [Verrucomicrobiales bacterium]
MAVVATTLRKGQTIRYEGETGVVLNVEHRTPGKGNALIMATIRSFHSGKTKDIRFASGDKVEIVPAERQKLEFSYSDPSGYHFMDPNTYETIMLAEELLEDSKELLKENLVVEVLFLEGVAVSVELPSSIELKVVQAAEGLRGDTANNPQKPATVETGKVIQVPLFVKEGDIIKVDSRTGKYTGRAN